MNTEMANLINPIFDVCSGLKTGYEIDGFLKAHDVYEDCTVQDIENEVAASIRLGV